MKEVWQQINNFPDYYISNQGRILSYRKKSKGRILKGLVDKDGYLTIYFYNDSGRKRFKIHRLVGEYFINNPENKPEINHKNGVKSDNNALNLEWCTISENKKHSYDILGINGPVGESNRGSKLTEKDVVEIRKLASIGEIKKKDIAKMYGVWYQTIYSICTKRSWKHI